MNIFAKIEYFFSPKKRIKRIISQAFAKLSTDELIGLVEDLRKLNEKNIAKADEIINENNRLIDRTKDDIANAYKSDWTKN